MSAVNRLPTYTSASRMSDAATPSASQWMSDPAGVSASKRSRWGRRLGSATTIFTSIPLQCRAFAVEGPAGNQVLHRDGIVAATEPLGAVQRVGRRDGVVVECHAQPRRVRHGQVAVD